MLAPPLLLLALVSITPPDICAFCTGEFSASLSVPASFTAEPTLSADSSAAALFSAPPTAAAEPAWAQAPLEPVDPFALEEDAAAEAALIVIVVAVGDRAPALAEETAAAEVFLGFSMDSSCEAFACGDGGAAGFSFFIEIL
jgi:hypothetical protein